MQAMGIKEVPRQFLKGMWVFQISLRGVCLVHASISHHMCIPQWRACTVTALVWVWSRPDLVSVL